MKKFFITTMGLAFFLVISALGNQAHAETGACYIRVKSFHINDEMMSDANQLFCYPDLTEEECQIRAQRKNFGYLKLAVYVLQWVPGKPCRDI